jgi:hypothetical protein
MNTLLARAAAVFPDNRIHQARWIRAVRFLRRATRRGWVIER